MSLPQMYTKCGKCKRQFEKVECGVNCCPTCRGKQDDWVTHTRGTGLTEHVCVHGVGHPDPASVQELFEATGDDSWGIHGCDGCCSRRDFPG